MPQGAHSVVVTCNSAAYWKIFSASGVMPNQQLRVNKVDGVGITTLNALVTHSFKLFYLKPCVQDS